MSIAELKEQVNRLTPAEKNELLQYLDPRRNGRRNEKIAAASAAMKRMDAGGGVSLERIFVALEDRDEPQR